MVGPHPPQCNCKCSPPVNFNWRRWNRVVGPQTPVYELSKYTQSWTTGGVFTYGGYNLPPAPGLFDIPPDYHNYMAPMRYEIGKFATSYATSSMGDYLRNAAMSATSPPLDGHLDSTTVSHVYIPCQIYGQGRGWGTTVYWNAVELFRNSVSLGVRIFSTPIGLTTVVTGGTYQTTTTPYTFVLDTPVTVVESDTWQWDLYCSIRKTDTIPLQWKIFAADSSGEITLSLSAFESTTTVFGTTSADGMKFVFGSNGPDGITELDMVTQTGWTRTDLGNTSIGMVNDAGTYTINFFWNREIPVIQFISTALWNNPSTFQSMMYIPADSGDYVSHWVTSLITETYGKWSPAGSTVFSNKRRVRTISPSNPPYYYTTTGDALDPGFPSSITVEPV